jgi:uncharacterized lipoprotein YmbA
MRSKTAAVLLSRLGRLSLLLVAPLLAHCGSVPITHYYVLETNPTDSANTRTENTEGIRVGVKAFQVDPPYDQDRIVYRVRDRSSEIGLYAYHRWASPLSRMLPVVVAAGLDGTEGLRSIEPVVPGREYDVYLVGRLLELEEVDRAAGQDVRVRIQLELRRPEGTEIWSQVVSGEDTVLAGDVVEVVETMNAVLAGAVADARPGFARALRALDEKATAVRSDSRP